MEKHNNLYYIFLQDKAAHPISKEIHDKILQNLLKIYKKIKPP